METVLSFLANTFKSSNLLYGTERFVPRLVLVALLLSQITSITSTTSEDGHKIRHSRNQEINGTRTPGGNFTLLNMCSEAYATIGNGRMTASETNPEHIAVELEFVPLPGAPSHYHIKRRSADQQYVCFSRTGRIRVRGRPSRSGRCTFTQTTFTAYIRNKNEQVTELRCAVRDEWYLGFNGSGDPMRAYDRATKLNHCFQFIKSPIEYSSYNQSTSQHIDKYMVSGIRVS